MALTQEAISPKTRLPGHGRIATTLKNRGIDLRAISLFLTINDQPVSPATVSTYPNTQHTTKTSNQT